jgi:hypothetical protein
MSVPVPARYKQLRSRTSLDAVSIGYSSVHLTPLPELEGAQQGYQADDWRPEWTVIGYEGLCGDPIFIDTDDEDYPVYTAEHGTGEWKPRLIAFTFSHFTQILQRLDALAQERDNPVRLKRRPQTRSESLSSNLSAAKAQILISIFGKRCLRYLTRPNQTMQPTASPRTAGLAQTIDYGPQTTDFS